MSLFIYFFILSIGLIVGSFIGALSYRYPRNISIMKGRSKCDDCHKTIYWYDNIPLLSFLFLQGKCRFCRKPIASRNPLIEIGTACLFLVTYLRFSSNSIQWLGSLGSWGLIYLFIITGIFITIFIIDWEHQIIPDSLTFGALVLTFLVLLLSNYSGIYELLLSGLGASFFLLLIHLITFGKGMGLGDVKFALLVGIILGPIASVVWILLAFIIGGLVGVLLMIYKDAKMRDKIAFGPFLIISFFIIIFTNISSIAFVALI